MSLPVKSQPLFGLASVILLILTSVVLILVSEFDSPIPVDPSAASPMIGFQEIGSFILVWISIALAALLASVLAVISLLRREARAAAVVSLSISMPILIYLTIAMLFLAA
ncbi:MAG TPA: hypothetical protein PKD26_03190 [Pyrinomonadaceae bacterium]|nr:hypothetical protein [Pyrinomonadaceae bacterium]